MRHFEKLDFFHLPAHCVEVVLNVAWTFRYIFIHITSDYIFNETKVSYSYVIMDKKIGYWQILTLIFVSFFGKIIEYARKHYKSYIERVQPKHLRPQNLIFENLQMYRGGGLVGNKSWVRYILMLSQMERLFNVIPYILQCKSGISADQGCHSFPNF